MIPLKDNIPTDRFPLVTVALILANVIVYVLSIRHGGSLWGGPDATVTTHYGAVPYELTHPGDHCDVISGAFGQQAIACEGQPGVAGTAEAQPATALTVLSSMFMHGSLLHIAGNMLFLWIFGNNVEDSMGPVKFIAFYVIGGLAALGLQVAINPGSTAPTVGASGAIAAVLGGYILLYPRARVLTLVIIILFVTVIELPALLVLGFWFAEQAAFAAANLTTPTGGGGGVAYFAHIGGFLFGLLAIKLFATKIKPVPPRIPVY